MFGFGEPGYGKAGYEGGDHTVDVGREAGKRKGALITIDGTEGLRGMDVLGSVKVTGG